MGVELIVKVSIIKIIWRESCSLQKFIIEKWSLSLVLEVAFSGNSTKSSIVMWSWKFSISRAQVLGATVFWFQKI
jgi:hypothetical protein